MTSKKHNYDWDAMGFDPDDGSIIGAFEWFMTPQGHQWWSDNEFTPEGQAEFERMKRLYAEDMAAKEGPVRTVTRKEVVPGVYGPIVIGYAHPDPAIDIRFSYQDDDAGVLLTPDELREAAQSLIQIADALDG